MRYTSLTYRPLVPGSDQHLALLERTRTPAQRLGSVLYPALTHRRACAAMAAAACTVPTKQETPDPARSEASTAPRIRCNGDEDGRSTECA